jgi:dTDP-glucose 4,6-dehydratase
MIFQPRRVLITGSAGFIGANYVHYFLASDPQVQIVSLDLLTYAGNQEHLERLPDASRHTFVRGDICDGDLVARLLREHQIDTIIHFAAESHVDRSIEGPGVFVRTNVVGTFTLLDAARRYWLDEQRWDASQCRFHHVSTDEVYGSLQRTDPAFIETSRYLPSSPYSASKAGSDHLVWSYFHTYKLPTTLTNCSNNYGPRQNREKLIPTIISSCLEGKKIPIYGDGSNIRDWLYVEDHCLGIDAVIRNASPGETYNLGGECERTNLDVARTICGLLDGVFPGAKPYSEQLTFVTDRPGHDWRYAINIEKVQRELKWSPRESFESGLQKTIAWYVPQAKFK